MPSSVDQKLAIRVVSFQAEETRRYDLALLNGMQNQPEEFLIAAKSLELVDLVPRNRCKRVPGHSVLNEIELFVYFVPWSFVLSARPTKRRVEE